MAERVAGRLSLRARRGSRVEPQPAPLRLLLAPRLRAAVNRIARLEGNGKARLVGFTVLGAAFWFGMFALAYRVVARFAALPEIGPFLATKLLSMVLLASSSILIFSSLISALSNFFLSPELERLVAAPVDRSRLVYARLAETIFDSSWMVLLFALPLLMAYGAAHDSAPAFYAALVFVLPPFVAIPCTIGVVLTAVLVWIFPARRTRDVLAVLMVAGGALLYVSLRLFQPERFLNPEGFGSFVEFVRALQTPAGAFLPSTWAVEVLAFGARAEDRLFHLGLLWSTAAAFAVLCEMAMSLLFASGFSKAIEGRGSGGVRVALIDVSVAWAPLAPRTRILIARDVKTFFRDTTQWSQLLLLAALVVVYVYNFSVIPTVASPVLTFYLKNVIAFANLALAAFVVAAIAARFVLPSISLEGRAFWITRTAPIGVRQIWWSKLAIGLTPLLCVAEALVLLTNYYLGVATPLRWLSAATIACLTPGIVALALAIGCAHPRFDVSDPAKVAAGLPGLAFMLLAAVFVFLVALLEAWPTYTLFTVHLQERPLSAAELLGVTAALGAALALTIAVPILAVRHGVRRLEAIEL